MGVLAGSLLAAPRVAVAQQVGRVFRIGILGNLRTGKPDLWGIFIEGLRDLGWVEGKNMVIEWRISEGRYERLPALAAWQHYYNYDRFSLALHTVGQARSVCR